MCTTLFWHPVGMDMDLGRHDGMTHEQRAEDTRIWLAGELRGLVDMIKEQLEADVSAGMTTALIQAYKELGRLYQVSERPGGKGLTELAVARMLEAARLEARAAVLAEMAEAQRAIAGRGSEQLRESLEALSNKSLG